MDKTKFITKTEIVKKYDEETGEEIIKNINISSFAVDREPEYIKLYIQDIGRLKKINGKANDILLAFISKMGYNNIIPTYKPIKMLIARDLNVSIHTVNSAIKKFRASGLFIPYVRGMYIADPELFARGNWKNIKNLRLVIDYKKDGTKKIKSNLSEEIQLKLNL